MSKGYWSGRKFSLKSTYHRSYDLYIDVYDGADGYAGQHLIEIREGPNRRKKEVVEGQEQMLVRVVQELFEHSLPSGTSKPGITMVLDTYVRQIESLREKLLASQDRIQHLEEKVQGFIEEHEEFDGAGGSSPEVVFARRDWSKEAE